MSDPNERTAKAFSPIQQSCTLSTYHPVPVPVPVPVERVLPEAGTHPDRAAFERALSYSELRGSHV